MCGITGLYAFNEIGRFNLINLARATGLLAKRGPDDQGMFLLRHVGLGHRRLSVIDLTDNAKQPMTDESGRYTIVYNGEIYNFPHLKTLLTQAGFVFRSTSDTEVLLNMYIWKGASCLSYLNGFFAFAIYDKSDDSLFIARDRLGVKPLHYWLDDDKIVFASELKSLLAYGLPRELDYSSLFLYLQLNYVPAPDTIFKGIKKLLPGHFMVVKNKNVSIESYYKIPYDRDNLNPEHLSYEQQQEKLKTLLDNAVQDRLIADVPLGAFLSGGIDSSVVVGLASRHTKNLNTFSIGYKDEPFFDETHYAELVAEHFKTNHTTFSLSNEDLYQHLFDILDYLDEPFADSSAIPTYVLSHHTKKTATVALSGDGADELMSGYTKHMAEYNVLYDQGFNRFANLTGPLWRVLPKSRSNYLLNKIRQLDRYAHGLKMTPKERYWQWATLLNAREAVDLLDDNALEKTDFQEAEDRRQMLLGCIGEGSCLNDVLYSDMQMVLPNDMLVKVDLMSMANGLEVRSPFLDYRLVDFVFQLPEDSKITNNMRKRILQESFRDMLPPQLYRRPKKGFEVPLLKWFRKELKPLIFNDLLNEDFVRSQNIFNVERINKTKKKLLSHDPGDAHAQIWALVVFQWWWKKYFC
jgi:asparagine synthase (glutamine-hydrolysing)